MQLALLTLIVLSDLSMFTSHRPGEETRTSGISSYPSDEEEHVSKVKADFRSRDLVRVPTSLSNDVTHLDLGRNKISVIRQDDFVNVRYLRVLVLSHNSINTLESGCFRHLRFLERLDLNKNNIKTFVPDVFMGLEYLRVLTMSELPLTSYPTDFVTHTKELRVLSLSAIGDATIPAEYARLPRLEVIDFYTDTDELVKITHSMFDNIRESNITTLSFRNMDDVLGIESGAFSNMSNTRSLVFACNKRLSFGATVASLAATRNTNVDNVVLDGARGSGSVFHESAFCSPFWRRVRRLSAKNNNIGAFSFNYAGCLRELREIVADYNSPTRLSPTGVSLNAIFTSLRVLSFSHRTSLDGYYDKAYCQSRQDMFDIDDYFPVRPPVLSPHVGELLRVPCGEDYINLLPNSLEYLYAVDTRMTPQWRVVGDFCSGNIRYINISDNRFFKTLCEGCRIVGDNRLEIIDLSYGILTNITSNFFNFPRLRFLNLSHNELGVSLTDFRETFAHLIKLEDINLSHNKLSKISPQAFERCTRLRRLNLADNELTRIDITIHQIIALEYIDLSGNLLVRLSDAFTAELDQQFQRQPLELNLQRHIFSCNCKTASFVRWIQVTHVILTDKDRLMCLYGNREDIPLTGISIDEFEAGCDVTDKELTVVVSIGVSIAILVVVVLWMVKYHRWYIEYHTILCWKREGEATTRGRENKYEAVVLYFMHSANPSDQQDGVARISRWVCTRLLPRAENEWGLRLYVGDRDDVGGASKMHNFVRGFRSSDKVVVCLTREFIDDIDCMNYLATALDSSKPLSKYIFVLFDDAQPTSVPHRLRQLLLPEAPSVQITWDSTEDGDEHAHQAFWQHMRDALIHDPDQERCRRRINTIPLLALIHDTSVGEQSPDTNLTDSS